MRIGLYEGDFREGAAVTTKRKLSRIFDLASGGAGGEMRRLDAIAEVASKALEKLVIGGDPTSPELGRVIDGHGMQFWCTACGTVLQIVSAVETIPRTIQVPSHCGDAMTLLFKNEVRPPVTGEEESES